MANINLGKKNLGQHSFKFENILPSSGIYFYRIELSSTNNANALTSSTSKMIFIK